MEQTQIQFTGTYEVKLDAKGRMALPFRLKAKLPKGYEDKIVVNLGFEPCLVVYSIPEWEKIYSKVSALNEFNEEDRIFQRNFGRGNTEIEMDDAGRLLVPKIMLKYASLDKEAMVIGMGNRIEIWEPKLYDQYLIKDMKEYSKLAQKVLGTKKPEGQ